MTRTRRLSLSVIVCGLALVAATTARSQTYGVAATVETDPVPGSGDAADDVAIWIHPQNTARSTIIGTDKSGGGLAVYDVEGRQLQYVSTVTPNNVDLRYNFRLANRRVALAVFSDRGNDTIGVYQVDPGSGMLSDAAARPINTGIPPYGLCLYRSPTNGRYYAFVTAESAGTVEQWQLFDDGSGRVDGARVRSFSLGSQSEGCVADDVHGVLYVAEEGVGIWRYGAEPGAGSARTLVDGVGGGRLNADVEGLTIYYASDGTGYLIASSQGSSEFVVYQRTGGNAHVGTFRIVAGAGIDAVSGADGIDVVNFPLGSTFPQGAFVAQDDTNDGANQNFKVVPWTAIAVGATPDLKIDTRWDPRAVGGGAIPPPPATTRVVVDTPSAGAARLQPFAVSGWALDPSSSSATGVDQVHVWAFPQGGGQSFLGVANYGLSRPDVGAFFGDPRFNNSGFSFNVNGLASGRYDIKAYARSMVRGTFDGVASVNVIVDSSARMNVDAPAPGTSARLPFKVAGWAIDRAASSGSGVSEVHVWAFRTDNQAGTFLGVASLGIARPDVAAAFGAQFGNAGFQFQVTTSLPQTRYNLVAYAKSAMTGTFNSQDSVTVTVLPPVSTPVMAVDVPSSGASVSAPFNVSGWAADLSSLSGTGVDQVHVWAFPTSGAAPSFLGAAAYGTSRPDVGAVYGSRFTSSGYSRSVTTALPAGLYDIAVYARSTVAGAFNNVRRVRIRVN